MTNLINKIREQQNSLNKSEKKVAEVILKDPEAATRASIATLARQSDVSEPTVNRFCKRFEIQSFPDFKIQLALSLVQGTPYLSQAVDTEDKAGQIKDKVFQCTIAALESARKSIDAYQLEKAIDYLSQAKQITFFGFGGSAPVALDAQHKFFRFNIPVTAYDDFLMQRMVAAAAHTGDVFVSISYTGRTNESVEVAKIARQTGATVIGITSPDSPLAQNCSLTLAVAPDENTDIYMPMTSRIVHLAIIDALATGVTLKRGVDFQPHLKKVKESLKGSRYIDKES